MDLDFLREQAEQWYNEGNIEEAKKFYHAAMLKGDGYSAGELGDIYINEGNIEKAIEIFEVGRSLKDKYSIIKLVEIYENEDTRDSLTKAKDICDEYEFEIDQLFGKSTKLMIRIMELGSKISDELMKKL